MDSDFNFTYFLFQVSQPTICGLNFELKSNLPHLTTKPEVLLLCQVLLEPNQRLHHHWFFWEHANTFRRLLKYAINHELERKKKIYNRSSVKIWVLHTIPASDNQDLFFNTD